LTSTKTVQIASSTVATGNTGGGMDDQDGMILENTTRGPWGQGPRPGGQKPGGTNGSGNRGNGGGRGTPPPDFDDFIRKGQDKLRDLFGSGRNSNRGIVLLLLVAVVLWLASGIYRVEPDEQGVVLRFGKFHHYAEPGLRYHLPAPIETVFKPKVTSINRMEIGFRSGMTDRRNDNARSIQEESLMLTGDENIVDIHFEVQWKIRDAYNYLFNVRSPEVAVKTAAESAMREVIGHTKIATALAEGRSEIEQSTRSLLQSILNDYEAGIEIVRLQLLKVDPPQQVIDAFRDVQTARQDQERLINQAEAYRNEILPRARGEAEKKVLEAEAYRERVVNEAEGQAARFVSVYNEYRKAQDVTKKRLYIETMEEIMQDVDKVLVDDDIKGMLPLLNLNDLKGKGAS